MDAKIKYLEMIQGVIVRMASNLFFLKGWAISLIAALFALAAKDTNPHFAYVALLPIAVFWVLDGYFLSQERQYRALYNYARQLNEADVDFSLDASAHKCWGKNDWFTSMFRPTLLWFYASLLVVMALTSYLINR